MSGRFNLADYVTVDERIDKFWADHRDDGNSVAIRALVYLGARLVATGIAQEERGNGGANKTSWWENAETSAIGRALANLGMSLSKQRPSREEMEKVERYDDRPPRTATPPRAQTPPQASPAPRSAPAAPAAVSQAAMPAPAPLTDAEYARLFEQAWTLVEDGRPYLDVVAFVKRSRDRMTEEQYAQSRDEVRTIRKAIDARDAETPRPASFAG